MRCHPRPLTHSRSRAMLAITQAKTLVNAPVRASAPQKRASRACARVIARANADDVNRRSFIRRAGFAALSLTVATPEEVRERIDARS